MENNGSPGENVWVSFGKWVWAWGVENLWSTLGAAIVAILVPIFIYRLLWLCGKETVIPERKRIHFYVLMFIPALFAGLIAISVIQHFSAQLSAIQRSFLQVPTDVYGEIFGHSVGTPVPDEYVALPYDEAVKKSKGRGVGITMNVEIVNRGKPTTLRNWRVEIELPGKTAIKAEIPNVFPNELRLSSNKGNPPVIIPRSKSIIDMARNKPIESGAILNGFISCHVQNLDDALFNLPGTKFIVHFEDAMGKPYTLLKVSAGQAPEY